MGENFIRFKRKAFIIRLIKSLLIGLSVGMLLTGAFLLLTKFEIIRMQPIFSFLIGGIAVLCAGVGGYFLLRTTDKDIAKRLDEEFALQEKVQTMLAYEKNEETIYKLQRNNANESLSEISTKQFKFKRLWAYIAAFLIGAGSLVSGFIFAPAEEAPPPEPNEEMFQITDIQIAAMEELIVYVENSQMQSPYKENVTQSLRTLLDDLQQEITITQSEELLAAAVDFILEETDNSSTAVELMDALWVSESNSSKKLAEALNYYEWKKSNEWTDFTSEMTDFRTSFVHADTVTSNPDYELMAQDTAEVLRRMQSNITSALARAGVPEEDGLYVQLTRFITLNEEYANGTHLYGIAILSEAAELIGYEKTQKELDATFAALNSELFKSLEQHSANTGTGEYAIRKLNDLFYCGLPRFERPNFYASSSGEEFPDEEDGEGNGGAGIGDGAVYGSDDLVLDPLTNTYVEYGKILDKYYALMFGKVEEGNYTEQEKDAMEKYFAILYGGFDEEGKEN